MKTRPWNPWDELESVRAEAERLWDLFLDKVQPQFDDPRQSSIAFVPDVDLVETSDDYRLYLAAPGFVEEDIDIIVHNKHLTVRGLRHPPYDQQRQQSRLSEWRYGYFERQVEFPQPIDLERLRASYETGVLTVIVAKRV
ncbi:MAG: Hsp20/alpha crystallin family protein [Planctomycetota bacterium]|nr:MAG: Hsp20/alpha crystallin family protein [Planctomycetota bacterium]REJ96198.1 MAG: Hsp20/alpha crystallin family protein [Planctomycetota bacterium]REK29354.1 MAG: Hsp20/alpha crystallin family protein [Planctomycetota bacterium]REK44180.1 MAG: Hsp20/alpha crystallin family protein [Planctomycetota bacterium]